MGCLIHKESKFNALEALKNEKILSNTREILDEQTFDTRHEKLIKAVNRIYDLALKSLFDKEGSNVAKFGIKETPYNRTDSRSNIVRAKPIDEAFNQIDNARKALGIYDSKESIGEYRKRMGLVGKSTKSQTFINEDSYNQSDYDSIQDFKKLVETGEVKQICKIG